MYIHMFIYIYIYVLLVSCSCTYIDYDYDYKCRHITHMQRPLYLRAGSPRYGQFS